MLKNINLLFISLAFIIISNKANSQLLKGDAFFSLKSGYLSLKDYTPRSTLGVNLDIMVSNKIGIHYDLLFGRKYIHAPLAPVGGGYAFGFLLKDSDGIAGPLLIGALLSLIPEGISYNINFNNTTSLSPYISPLQFDHIKQENQKSGTDSFAGGAIGLKASLLVVEKIRIAPFAEYKIHYNKQTHPGIFTGISIGYKFSKNEDSNEFGE